MNPSASGRTAGSRIVGACPESRSRSIWIWIWIGVVLAPSAARAQGSLDRIRSRGELVIATDPTYPPFEYVENGLLQGFDVDLGNTVGRELGVRVRWLPMEWAGVMGALETGKADLVLAGVTITPERKKAYAFTRPYFPSGQTLARRRGDESVQSVRDLLGKIAAVQQETTGQYGIEKAGVPRERIHRFDQLQDALMDVRNGRADAAVGDEPALREILRKGYPELELVGGVFVHEYLGIVARRDELDLVGAINQILENMLVDGRYARLYQQWIRQPVTTEMIGELARVRDMGTPVPEKMLPTAGGGGPGAAGAGSEAAPAVSGSAFTIRWGLLWNARRDLLLGALLTLQITFLTLLFGIPAGLLIALARLAGFPPLRWVATVYVEAVRGTPLLMQIYVIYFVLPALNVNLPPMGAAVAALSLNAAAYISEIFRAGIESIHAGQMEAARSLGMTYLGAMRWVILPQTLRRVLPPLTNESVALLKDSSLVSVVALSELMRRGKELATNAGSPTTVFLGVALLYLAMTLPLTYLARRLEARRRPRPRKVPLTLRQPSLATQEEK